MNNQNESPFANPRFITSIIVVFLFLWGWQYYVSKTYPAPPKTSLPVIAQNPETKTQESAATAASPKKDEPILKTAQETTFDYEDESVKWQISSYGMGLNYFELKTYFNNDRKPVIFQGTTKLFSLAADGAPLYFDLKQVSANQFTGRAEVNGKIIKRTVTYHKDEGSFDSEVEFEGAPEQISFVTSEPKHVHGGGGFLVPNFQKQDFLFKDNEKVKTENISSLKDGDTLNKTAPSTSLASIGSQYFTQSYIDKSEILPSANMTVSQGQANLNINYDLKNAKISKLRSVIYVGPKVTEKLAKIDPIQSEVLDYGMFGFISKPLLMLMKFLHGLFGNWGLSIIALTVAVRLLMLPFNIVSFKSARAMQKIQPQLQAIREKYKNDPMQVNRETMALMKEEKANPLSSCLPMLIQIPIFFALWRTIGSSIEIYQQPFFGWITDLSSHDKFFVLPVLMGVTMFFQQKLTPTTMDPTQAKILNFMPVLFSVFMLSLPSGLTLYNFVSALFGVTQQYFLIKDSKKN